MGLFGGKETKKKAAAPAKKAAPKKVARTKQVKASSEADATRILMRPRITEKAANLTAERVYTFDVHQDATKKDVAKAVAAVYRVTPVKVNIVKTAGKRKRLRTRRGFGKSAASKKAYVFLKEGDRIEFSS